MSGGEVAFVAGPVWRETEEETEVWGGEVQTIGGYNVVATVYGSSEHEVGDRQKAIIAALAPSAPPAAGRIVRDPIPGLLAALSAAISLLEKGGKKAAPSDKMFEQMLKDYRKALDAGRAAPNPPAAASEVVREALEQAFDAGFAFADGKMHEGTPYHDYAVDRRRRDVDEILASLSPAQPEVERLKPACFERHHLYIGKCPYCHTPLPDSTATPLDDDLARIGDRKRDEVRDAIKRDVPIKVSRRANVVEPNGDLIPREDDATPTATHNAEAEANAVIATVETWLSRQGGFRGYAERVLSGGTGWNQLRSTIWLAVHARSALATPTATHNTEALREAYAVGFKDGGDGDYSPDAFLARARSALDSAECKS